jgi:hypothetical protein
MNIFFGIIGVLILLTGLPLLLTWISERSQKRFMQKMNKRFEYLEKYLKESGNGVGTDRNYMQTN